MPTICSPARPVSNIVDVGVDVVVAVDVDVDVDEAPRLTGEAPAALFGVLLGCGLVLVFLGESR